MKAKYIVNIDDINSKPLNEKNVQYYIDIWKNDNVNKGLEDFLDKLFTKEFPENTKEKEIFQKIKALNLIYGTHLGNEETIRIIAENIKNLKIDKKLDECDFSVVKEIANASADKKRLFSFATKYCSFHKKDEFPIYDKNVATVLWYLENKNKHCCFTEYEIDKYRNSLKKDYVSFKDLVSKYKGTCSFRDFDHYLWYEGNHILKEIKEKRILQK